MFTGIVTDVGRIVETRVTGDLRARIATGYAPRSLAMGFA
jgi:riboflavin synthase